MRTKFASAITIETQRPFIPFTLVGLRAAYLRKHILSFVCRQHRFLKDSIRQFQEDRSNKFKMKTVPPISVALLERSNLAFTHRQAGLGNLGNKYLTGIGDLAKTIRVQQGDSRNVFAQKLGITPEQLLFLETGFGIDEDITVEQLLYLCDYLLEPSQEELRALLAEYSDYLQSQIANDIPCTS